MSVKPFYFDWTGRFYGECNSFNESLMQEVQNGLIYKLHFQLYSTHPFYDEKFQKCFL